MLAQVCPLRFHNYTTVQISMKFRMDILCFLVKEATRYYDNRLNKAGAAGTVITIKLTNKYKFDLT